MPDRSVLAFLAMWAIVLFTVAGCSIPLKVSTGEELCVVEWSKEFATKAGAEAEALPPGSALREVVAQYVDVRQKAKRC